MDLNEMAQQIHENAVRHGFWPEDRTDAEVLALIHSEWSEALEAYRSDEPMEWHYCKLYGGRCYPNLDGVLQDDTGEFFCYNCGYVKEAGNCDGDMHGKPEGVAIELADGCIRILDACAAWGIEPMVGIGRLYYGPEWIEKQDLPWLVSYLHYETSCVFSRDIYGGGHAHDDKEHCAVHFDHMLATVFVWLKSKGIDPEAVILEKHEYNKTRPFKHNKKI